MKHDKKNVSGQINFVLLEAIENYKIDCKVATELIIESLDFYRI
jgi:3-dehydroquinate synthase